MGRGCGRPSLGLRRRFPCPAELGGEGGPLDGLLVMRATLDGKVNTYVAVTVEEAEGEPTRLQLRLDGIFLAGPPWKGDDLRVVLPRLAL